MNVKRHHVTNVPVIFARATCLHGAKLESPWPLLQRNFSQRFLFNEPIIAFRNYTYIFIDRNVREREDKMRCLKKLLSEWRNVRAPILLTEDPNPSLLLLLGIPFRPCSRPSWFFHASLERAKGGRSTGWSKERTSERDGVSRTRKRERGRVRENKGERETEIEWEAERERRMCEQQRCISVQRSIHRVEVNARPYSGPRKEREGMEGAIEGRGGRGRETEGKHWAEKMNKHSERPEKGRIECSCTIPLFPFFTSC